MSVSYSASVVLGLLLDRKDLEREGNECRRHGPIATAFCPECGAKAGKPGLPNWVWDGRLGLWDVETVSDQYFVVGRRCADTGDINCAKRPVTLKFDFSTGPNLEGQIRAALAEQRVSTVHLDTAHFGYWLVGSAS